MSKSELMYIINSEKPKIDWDTRVTISQVRSACKISRGYKATVFEIIYAIENSNGGLVKVDISELLKNLSTACKEGYVKLEKRKYSLTAKGIDAAGGEAKVDLEHRRDLAIRGIKYRNSR